MSDQARGTEYNWDRAIGDDYEVLPDGRVPVWIMGLVGDQARAVTPWNKHDDPIVLSAAEIARDCDLPTPGEVVGREFIAAGDANGLHDFELKHDPRK
ncbi:hypothetical protein IU501_22985 [Nocardia otitidiscaviarum]|uniref:hypothetical protein n=1 Tax=Nocardia otitidiscaviarum TaxID=1823 RepID=UPI0004A74022|nr:hypothetical protein [Nocardia otitidiscaviarum]MBF6135860.1 hypothetical protein [Nocardia otitidiscaviarum]